MSDIKNVKFGIIGIGNIGTRHFESLAAGKIPNGELTAACDLKPEKLDWAREKAPGIALFSDYKEMIASGVCDTIIIAVPHYQHPEIGIYALDHGMNVITEKPIGVYTEAIPDFIAAAERSGKVFSMMFNQRTNPLYQKMHEIVQGGELGELKRSVWVVNNWYRSQGYYDSGDWRATWAGEGGGVLLNQCPHNLDLWQWICGMPSRIRAFCKFGHYHNIEVEDDVTAFAEYPNGATGTFITSTGEAPGVNRFEIFGTMGRLTLENDKLTFLKLRQSEREFCATAPGFGSPDYDTIEYTMKQPESQHDEILKNVVKNILSGEKLIAPGPEGINQLTLTNAMLLSQWTDNWVDLPLDAKLYHSILEEKIASSRFVKTANDKTLDVSNSY